MRNGSVTGSVTETVRENRYGSPKPERPYGSVTVSGGFPLKGETLPQKRNTGNTEKAALTPIGDGLSRIRTYAPLSNRFTIPAARRETEFEIQAWLFATLRSRGVRVCGELRWCGAKREQCRFDLVRFEGDLPAEIIEVKDTIPRDLGRSELTRQCRRYREFGVPVTFVYGMEGATEYAERLAAKPGC